MRHAKAQVGCARVRDQFLVALDASKDGAGQDDYGDA
jgi:hypothetical protein